MRLVFITQAPAILGNKDGHSVITFKFHGNCQNSFRSFLSSCCFKVRKHTISYLDSEILFTRLLVAGVGSFSQPFPMLAICCPFNTSHSTVEVFYFTFYSSFPSTTVHSLASQMCSSVSSDHAAIHLHKYRGKLQVRTT